MALPPRFSGHRMGSAIAPHVIECFLDYTVEYSLVISDSHSAHSLHAPLPASSTYLIKNIYPTHYAVQDVIPHYETKCPGAIQFIFRHQIQPWHPQSTLLHEAALAVERLDQNLFFSFSQTLFEHSTEYYDLHAYHKTTHEMHEELAQLAERTLSHSFPAINKESVSALLQFKGNASDANGGNAMTDDLKWHIKYARQNAIHVSPTFIIGGLIDNGISSGWTLQQWQDYIMQKFSM